MPGLYFHKLLHRPAINEYLNAISGLIFPTVCGFCGRSIAESSDIESVCRFCAARLPLRSSSDIFERCIEDNLLLQLQYRLSENFTVIVCCHYESMIRKAMLEMKFYEAAYHKEAFGSIMALTLGLTGKSYDCIIPIPLHEKRLKERGYNQALLIAEKLSSITGIPVIRECLIRNHYTGRQSETKNRVQRIDNLTDVFHCARPDLIEGKKILLLDDVLTSGATIFSAARSMRSAAAPKNGKDGIKKEIMDITGIALASERHR